MLNNDGYLDLTEAEADVNANMELLEQEDTQLHRRNYIRSRFVLLEGVVDNLRERTARDLIQHFQESKVWKLHRLTPLLDDSSRPGGTGNLDYNALRTPFLNKLAYIFRVLTELKGAEPDCFSDNRWNDLRNAVHIRHRITHPKINSPFEITQEDLQVLQRGLSWFNETLLKINRL